jgi:hypothetical protein
METIILHILTLLGTGGIGTIAGWFFTRKSRAAKEAKAVHDAEMPIYANLQTLLNESQAEIKKLTASVRRLEHAITKAYTCVHYDDCPIRDELQNGREHDNTAEQPPKRAHRQRYRKATGDHPADNRPGGMGGDQDTDRQPPANAGRQSV